jgi:hypothetical protein
MEKTKEVKPYCPFRQYHSHCNTFDYMTCKIYREETNDSPVYRYGKNTDYPNDPTPVWQDEDIGGLEDKTGDKYGQ